MDGAARREAALIAASARLRRYPRLYAAARRWLRPVAAGAKDESTYIRNSFNVFAPHFRGGRVLEIGPGSNLGVSLLFAAAGAEAVAVDIAPLLSPHLAPLYHDLLTHPPVLLTLPPALRAACPTNGTEPGLNGGLERADSAVRSRRAVVANGGQRPKAVAEEDGRRQTAWAAGEDGRRRNGSGPGCPPVRYSLAMVEQLPFAEHSFDFVFSNASFEHFRAPSRAIAEMWRILKPGGCTVHQIDLRDHRHQDDPLRFLQYSDRLWRLMHPLGPSMYQNRWRLSHYRRAFERVGFDVEVEVNLRTRPADLQQCRHFARRFAAMSEEDATALGCLTIARKPG